MIISMGLSMLVYFMKPSKLQLQEESCLKSLGDPVLKELDTHLTFCLLPDND